MSTRGGGLARPMRSSANKVILLIRPEASARGDVAESLQRCGYLTWSATDGATAHARMQQETMRPDLIVLDWGVPNDSTFFLSRLASDPRLSFAPVIVLVDIAQMRAVPSSRVAALMAKPVRTKTLVEVIDRLCSMPRRLQVVDFDTLADSSRTERTGAPAGLVDAADEVTTSDRLPDRTVRLRRRPSPAPGS
jgi:CheY-like chemotaxis protein